MEPSDADRVFGRYCGGLGPHERLMVHKNFVQRRSSAGRKWFSLDGPYEDRVKV